jgi:hypothetical protein
MTKQILDVLELHKDNDLLKAMTTFEMTCLRI